MRTIALFAILADIAAGQSGPDIRRTVTAALAPIEKSASAFVAKRACVSCHHNILPVLLLHGARDRGFAVDSAVLTAVEAKTFHALRGPAALDDAIQAVTLNDPTPDDSYLLMAAHAAGLPPDLITAVYARRLAGWQRDGHWVTSDFRPPHSSSIFTATATAVRAVALYMPPELSAERDACLDRARRWLATTRPASTEDAAFRLLGLVWTSAPPAEIAGAGKDLLALRTPAGAWSELPGYPPDAYSTGESLYALYQAGMAPTDRAWLAGAKFLISTQAADGTWRVHTRMLSPAEVSPEYFATGFPYAKDEFLSYAGSVWAVMALLEAFPANAAPVPKPALEGTSWTRTALFGTAGELAVLLDHGLDPNSKTDKGTTLLMMAVSDADKVKLLLSRGAEPKARAGSGVDALTIAASVRGTTASIQQLLDAGAEVNPPDGVRVKNSALLFASMTGDTGIVQLLLSHGAKTGAAAGLSQAVTFGYPDIVRALIAAGTPAKVTASGGINLLHWATIANRPEVIPALVEAGVSLNAQDDFDYTPLMYAATLDFGDTLAAQALRKAGANPAIRNGDGRTALQQARHFKHVHLESVLH